MKNTGIVASASLGAMLFASAAGAQQQSFSDAEVRSALRSKLAVVETLAFHPRLVAAVKRQNATPMPMEEIRRHDSEWQSGSDPSMFKHSLENSPVSDVLATLVRGNAALTEAFLTDRQGANVAMYPTTSDFWQGDEEKFTAAYNQGEGQVYIGPVELDDSTQTYQVQVSAPVIDIDNRATIGVLVVGVSLDFIRSAVE